MHLCVYQVLNDGPGFSGKLQAVRKVYVSDSSQLFSKSDRRSSLLLLGRSGGSRYDNSSSGLASSGSSCKVEEMINTLVRRSIKFFMF